MDRCVSVSAGGKIALHSIRKGTFIRWIKLPKPATPATLAASASAVVVSPKRPSLIINTPASSGGSGSDDKSSPVKSGSAAAAATASTPANRLSDHLTQHVSIACDGSILFYSHQINTKTAHPITDSGRLSLCNINGRHWLTRSVPDPILALTISADGRWLVTGSDAGEISLRRLYEYVSHCCLLLLH